VLWLEEILTCVWPLGLLIVCWVEPLAGTLTGWPLIVTLVDDVVPLLLAASLLPALAPVLEVATLAVVLLSAFGADEIAGTVAEVWLACKSIDAGCDLGTEEGLERRATTAIASINTNIKTPTSLTLELRLPTIKYLLGLLSFFEIKPLYTPLIEYCCPPRTWLLLKIFILIFLPP
jgi:hypothetical protein